jgi:hypothetical protein
MHLNVDVVLSSPIRCRFHLHSSIVCSNARSFLSLMIYQAAHRHNVQVLRYKVQIPYSIVTRCEFQHLEGATKTEEISYCWNHDRLRLTGQRVAELSDYRYALNPGC